MGGIITPPTLISNPNTPVTGHNLRSFHSSCSNSLTTTMLQLHPGQIPLTTQPQLMAPLLLMEKVRGTERAFLCFLKGTHFGTLHLSPSFPSLYLYICCLRARCIPSPQGPFPTAYSFVVALTFQRTTLPGTVVCWLAMTSESQSWNVQEFHRLFDIILTT